MPYKFQLNDVVVIKKRIKIDPEDLVGSEIDPRGQIVRVHSYTRGDDFPYRVAYASLEIVALVDFRVEELRRATAKEKRIFNLIRQVKR